MPGPHDDNMRICAFRDTHIYNLCAYGQTKQTAEVSNFEADEQRAAKEVRHALHHHYYHHVNFTLSFPAVF